MGCLRLQASRKRRLTEVLVESGALTDEALDRELVAFVRARL